MIGKSVGFYRLTAKLGTGSMGEVFRAQDTLLDRTVALRVLSTEMTANQERFMQFLRELRIVATFTHPQVCSLYEINQIDHGITFVAMEYVEGQSLDDLVKNQGVLEISHVREIAVQLATTLDAIHTHGIVHRHIKPTNIKLNKYGQVKVLNLALSQWPLTESPESVTTQELQPAQQKRLVRNLPYLSPEQALGKDLDHRSDIFSIGVLLFELTTGKRPFSGADLVEIINNIAHAQPQAITQLNPQVPAELERITLQCLEKLPERRYQTALELMADLQKLEVGSHPPQRILPWQWRR